MTGHCGLGQGRDPTSGPGHPGLQLLDGVPPQGDELLVTRERLLRLAAGLVDLTQPTHGGSQEAPAREVRLQRVPPLRFLQLTRRVQYFRAQEQLRVDARREPVPAHLVARAVEGCQRTGAISPEWWLLCGPARIASTSVPPGGETFASGSLEGRSSFEFVPGVPGTWEYVDEVSGATGTLTGR